MYQIQGCGVVVATTTVVSPARAVSGSVSLPPCRQCVSKGKRDPRSDDDRSVATVSFTLKTGIVHSRQWVGRRVGRRVRHVPSTHHVKLHKLQHAMLEYRQVSSVRLPSVSAASLSCDAHNTSQLSLYTAVYYLCLHIINYILK